MYLLILSEKQNSYAEKQTKWHNSKVLSCLFRWYTRLHLWQNVSNVLVNTPCRIQELTQKVHTFYNLLCCNKEVFQIWDGDFSVYGKKYAVAFYEKFSVVAPLIACAFSRKAHWNIMRSDISEWNLRHEILVDTSCII